jgi:hypothetical protein
LQTGDSDHQELPWQETGSHFRRPESQAKDAFGNLDVFADLGRYPQSIIGETCSVQWVVDS